MKKIFVTGGAGFIGSHSIDLLLKEGYAVSVYDKKPWNDAINLHHQKSNISYIEGDIRDLSQLKNFMKGHSHVLHLAALVSVPESIENPVRFHDTNVTGTLNVFETARKTNIDRVVYASSAAIYGNQKELPIREDSKPLPMSPYGQNKLMNEMHADLYNSQYGLPCMGLRYFNVFGARQDPSSPYSGVISIFDDRIKKDKSITIFGDGSVTRDFVSVHDVAHANLLALMSQSKGACNIGTGKAQSIHDVARALGDVYEKQVICEYKSVREGDIPQSVSSIEKAMETLSYKPEYSFDEGIKKMVV